MPAIDEGGPCVWGRRYDCACPSAEHVGFFQVEAAGAADAVRLLPEDMRSATKMFAGEPMVIPA